MIVGEEEIVINDLYYVLMKNNIGNVKQCKTLIKHGLVYVNGEIIKDIKYQVCDDDQIMYQQHLLKTQPFVYYMMNKPKGYICASHDKVHRCVLDLIEEDDCYCVGRLDKDTTGLLLITNDKSLSKKLLLPDNHVHKTYFVTTLHPLKKEDVQSFQKGITIDKNVKCLPSQLDIIDEHHCFVTLQEGKYHQVKKMMLSCHNQVIELKRVQFHQLILDEKLKEGEYRSLNKEEILSLR